LRWPAMDCTKWLPRYSSRPFICTLNGENGLVRKIPTRDPILLGSVGMWEPLSWRVTLGRCSPVKNF
jgi:hypothetical protein